MSLLLLSDLHLVPPGGLLFGQDPRARLDEAIATIQNDHPEADGLLILGDLAHRGEAAAYRNLAEALAPLSCPVHLMLGNHDARAPFYDVFGTAQSEAGFQQFVLNLAGTPLICLDTLDDGSGRSDGTLCAERLDWLGRQIPRTGPWLLALHHPPMLLGLPNMDRIRLRDGDALYGLLAPNPPKMMLMGHVHRPITGVWRDIPFRIQRAVAHQVAWRPAKTPDLMFNHEPPELGILTMTAEGPVIHTRGFASEGPAFAKS